jgi:hypothetical protein
MKTHPNAPHHLPSFITEPGQTDYWMIGVGVFLIIAVLMVGVIFLRLHSLPERMAHKGHKLQFEIVAVLCLLALFTHQHIFWVAALLLAFIEIPDFGGSFNRMAGSLEKIAGQPSSPGIAPEMPDETGPVTPRRKTTPTPDKAEVRSGGPKEVVRA